MWEGRLRMLHKISSELAGKLLKRTETANYSQDVYIYGIELFISTLAELIFILCTSLVFASFWEGAVFLVWFFTLRIFSGGYHAGTYRNCFLVTAGAFLSIELMTGILVRVNYGSIIYCILVLAGAYIMIHAPLLHKKHPLSQEKMIKNGKIASVITLLQIAAADRLYVYTHRLFYIASLTTCFAAVLMLIANIENAKEGVSRQWDSL